MKQQASIRCSMYGYRHSLLRCQHLLVSSVWAYQILVSSIAQVNILTSVHTTSFLHKTLTVFQIAKSFHHFKQFYRLMVCFFKGNSNLRLKFEKCYICSNNFQFSSWPIKKGSKCLEAAFCKLLEKYIHWFWAKRRNMKLGCPSWLLCRCWHVFHVACPYILHQI